MPQTLVIEFFASGAGWRQGPPSIEESWGIDNVRVIVKEPLPGDMWIQVISAIFSEVK